MRPRKKKKTKVKTSRPGARAVGSAPVLWPDYAPLKKEIGRAIRHRRSVLKINQLSFCDLIDISQHTLSNLENGTGNVSTDNLIRVLDTLGLELKVELKIPPGLREQTRETGEAGS